MPVTLVRERFAVTQVRAGAVVTQHLPVRSIWAGQDRQLFVPNPNIRRVVISCHGVGSNADAAADGAHDAAQAAGVASETLVIAPQFVVLSDLLIPGQVEAEPNVLYWGSARFWGARSISAPYPRPVVISTMTVLDQILEMVVSGLYPNLDTIVLVGQSGGGQLVLRHAFASTFVTPGDIALRYVPMNPGNVPYASPKRVVPGASTVRFEVPTDALIQAAIDENNPANWSIADVRERYDRWGLGLQRLDRYNYVSTNTADRMRARFQSQTVAYLIGALDTATSGNDVPDYPTDRLQGRHRLERSETYVAHLKDEGLWNEATHVRRVVPGVGHWGRGTMLSEIGLRYLFDVEPPGAVLDGRVPADTGFLDAVNRINAALPGRAPLSPGDLNTLRARGLLPGNDRAEIEPRAVFAPRRRPD